MEHFSLTHFFVNKLNFAYFCIKIEDSLGAIIFHITVCGRSFWITDFGFMCTGRPALSGHTSTGFSDSTFKVYPPVVSPYANGLPNKNILENLLRVLDLPTYIGFDSNTHLLLLKTNLLQSSYPSIS